MNKILRKINITNQFVTTVSSKDMYSNIKLMVLFGEEDAKSGNPFHTDWIYSRNILEKYILCLDENDELRVIYQKADLGDWLGDIEDLDKFR